MLERSVGLDPSYAPAWGYLGVRYNYDGAYSNGGEAMRKRSNLALERAVSLDPNYIFAIAWLITNRVEQSELAKAYQDAKGAGGAASRECTGPLRPVVCSSLWRSHRGICARV